MAKDRILKPDETAAIDLAGRPFLHQQGSTVTRGYVVSLNVEDGYWDLAVRDVQYLNRISQVWEPGPATDEYGGQIRHEAQFQEDAKTGVISIDGYAMETYIGPNVENPWRRVHWPATDYTGEGKLRG